MAHDNYYELLGINSDAETVVITAAYKALAKKYHPDIYPDKAEGEEKLKLLNIAYETLSDPDKRKRYDASFSSGYDHEEPKPEADKPYQETKAAKSWSGLSKLKGIIKRLLVVAHWILFILAAFYVVLALTLGLVLGASSVAKYLPALVVVIVFLFVPPAVVWIITKRWIFFPWKHNKD